MKPIAFIKIGEPTAQNLSHAINNLNHTAKTLNIIPWDMEFHIYINDIPPHLTDSFSKSMRTSAAHIGKPFFIVSLE